MSDQTDQYIRVRIAPRTVGIVMTAIVLILGGIYSVFTLARFFAGDSGSWQGEFLFELYNYFHLGKEGNLPTYVSGLYLLLAGLLLTLITLHERANRGELTLYWLGLAIGFIFMSFDEVTMIHDRLVESGVDDIVGERPQGIWHYGWPRVLIPLVFIIAGLYLPFLRRIPSKYTKLFVSAGGIYVGGAIGIELVEAYVVSTYARDEGIPVTLTFLVEEMCELLGVVLLVYALLLYISERGITVQITAGSDATI